MGQVVRISSIPWAVYLNLPTTNVTKEEVNGFVQSGDREIRKYPEKAGNYRFFAEINYYYDAEIWYVTAYGNTKASLAKQLWNSHKGKYVNQIKVLEQTDGKTHNKFASNVVQFRKSRAHETEKDHLPQGGPEPEEGSVIYKDI